jgi:hypothetical protein
MDMQQLHGGGPGLGKGLSATLDRVLAIGIVKARESVPPYIEQVPSYLWWPGKIMRRLGDGKALVWFYGSDDRCGFKAPCYFLEVMRRAFPHSIFSGNGRCE